MPTFQSLIRPAPAVTTGALRASATRQPAAVPTALADLTRSPGQPLSETTRAAIEPRFGADFSHVRVHTDDQAERSAARIAAAAYTVGPNIVFGAGAFQPETRAGRALLAHELTHVIQQQRATGRSPEVGPASDAHEAQASVVAERITHGEAVAGVLAAPLPSTTPVLQRQPARGGAQPPQLDTSIVRIAELDPSQTDAFVKTQVDQAVKAGDITRATTRGSTKAEEVFLLAVIYGLAKRTKWNTTSNVVAPIGRPAKGAAAPRGQIRVRIDATGHATAELLARGVPTTTTQTTIAALQTTYGLAAVREDTAKWSAAEINDVGAALAMLPPADAKVLNQVELIRVSSITGKPADAGQFSFPTPIAPNAAAVNRRAELRLANKAFDHNQVQFSGDATKRVPASYRTILHEVGHAIESEVYRQAWRDHAQAIADVKAASETPEPEKRQKERAAAIAARDAAKSPRDKKKYEDRIAGYDLDLTKAQDTAADEKAAQVKIKDKEKIVADMDKAGSTDRLKKFMAIVTQKKIRPLTAYAATGDAEFYAETYATWLVDRQFLKDNYLDLFNFFENGDYRR